MKPYLTYIFIALSVLILIIGLQTDVYWNGIASWGLAFISFGFGAYYTKYIRDDRNKK